MIFQISNENCPKIKINKFINPWPTSESVIREEPHTTPHPTKSEKSEPQEVDLPLNMSVKEPKESNSLDQPKPKSLVLRRSTMPRTEPLATHRDLLPDLMEASLPQFNSRRESSRLSLARRLSHMSNRLESKKRKRLTKRNNDC